MKWGPHGRHCGHLVVRCGMLALLIGATCGTQTARAENSYVDMFFNGQWQQVGDGPNLANPAWYFASDLHSVNAGDYSSVQMSYPGPSSANLTQLTSTLFSYESYNYATYTTQAQLDAAYPMGTYTFSASNGGPADTTSLGYTAQYYAQTTPYFTGTTYSDLQGVNAGKAFTVTWNSFDPGSLPAGSTSSIYFTVYDITTGGNIVYDTGALPDTTTSWTIPAHTMVAGDQYAVQLDFDNRVFQTTSNAVYPGFIGYDLRDELYFTAVPEPGTVALLAPSCAALAWVTLRRRRAR